MWIAAHAGQGMQYRAGSMAGAIRLIKQHLGPQLRQITAVQRICRVLVKVCEAQLIPGLPEEPSRDEVPDAEDISQGHKAALDLLNVRQVRLCTSHHIETVIPKHNQTILRVNFKNMQACKDLWP